KKITALRAVRLAVQIAFFIFLPALYINAFLDLKLVLTSITGGSFDIGALLPQTIELIAIVPVTILLGRFFCGWMCAFGAFGDFLYGVSKKLFKTNFRMNEKADRLLKFAKYGMLAFVVIVLWMVNVPAFSSASPWDVFGMLATVGAAPALSYVLTNLTAGFIFFILIAIGSAFVQRFFCRYICPLGAVFRILSALKMTTIVKPSRKCGNCRVCTNACVMGIPLYKNSFVHTGECIECLQCVAACPRNNVRYCLAGSDVRPLVAGTMAAIAIAGVYNTTDIAFAAAKDVPAVTVSAQASGTPSHAEEFIPASAQPSSVAPSPTQSASSSPSVTPAKTQASGAYADGTYTGVGTGFRGTQTKVTVTIKSGAITDIVTVSYGDDTRYYNRAFGTLSPNMKNSQSANVDAVSGATYSSDGIMQAVSDALQKATAA
ncbi:MAG TPA: 4Fe-4S binding protein, partial [Sedimentisphaerales bacterium]